LHDRGYYVSEKSLEEKKEEFEKVWKEAQDQGAGRERFLILVNHTNQTDKQLIVFFPDESKRVGVKPIRILAEKMDERKIREAILVVKQPLTPLARTAIQEASVKMRIEVFHENELIVNITQHELVPQHVALSDEEKQQLLNRYKMKPSQLPRIQVTDPVARYFGMQRDQVMKIIRPSETAGRYVTYRRSWFDAKENVAEADGFAGRMLISGMAVSRVRACRADCQEGSKSSEQVPSRGWGLGRWAVRLLGFDAFFWLTRKMADARSVQAPELHSVLDVHGFQLFFCPVFNADPHPGNILMMPDGRIGLIDFGQCRRLSSEEKAASSGQPPQPEGDAANASRPLAELTQFRTRQGNLMLFAPQPMDTWIGKEVLEDQSAGGYRDVATGKPLSRKLAASYMAFCKRHTRRCRMGDVVDKYIRLVDKYQPKVFAEARIYVARFPEEAGDLFKQIKKVRKQIRKTRGGRRQTRQTTPSSSGEAAALETGSDAPQGRGTDRGKAQGEEPTAMTRPGHVTKEDADTVSERRKGMSADTPPDWGDSSNDDAAPTYEWPWGTPVARPIGVTARATLRFDRTSQRRRDVSN
ncbi:NRPB5A, partial [Symbiodinium necroappetens]